MSTTHRGARAAATGHGPSSPHPDEPRRGRRAAQDVRHPVGVLADGEHRRHVDHRLRSPSIVFGKDQRPDLRQLRAGLRHPDVGDPADRGHPRGDLGVEPAQRADHLHAGAAPRPGGRRQGRSPPRSSPSVSMALAFAIGAVGTVVGSAVHGTDVVWDISMSRRRSTSPPATASGWRWASCSARCSATAPAAIVAYFVYSLRGADPVGPARRAGLVAPRPALGRLQLRPVPRSTTAA